jgi:hypothetical protein
MDESLSECELAFVGEEWTGDVNLDGDCALANFTNLSASQKRVKLMAPRGKGPIARKTAPDNVLDSMARKDDLVNAHRDFLRTLQGEIKDVQEDMRRLKRKLDIISISIEKFDKLYELEVVSPIQSDSEEDGGS